MRWVVLTFRRAFDFTGRSRRTEYWGFLLAFVVAQLVISSVDRAFGIATGGSSALGGLAGSLLVAAVLIPGLAVAIRRLHDSGWSGLWLALPVAPIVFWAVMVPAGFDPDWLWRVVLVALCVGPLALLVLLAQRGNDGANRFGPDPRLNERDDASAVVVDQRGR